ncbi:MAG TPA: WG repeat-containing protein [Ohtaekwangia sp.]|uniref:WG repeat-containing protein n=1 Tax=Ohtaekwangia sp. TaxID=2066019 RepID=UPI002F9335D2
MDASGVMIIKPIFLNAGEFSEGVAPARIHGAYGYIDRTGNFVIQPQFDYALPFAEGLALVYKNGRPFFINRQGIPAFAFSFPHATSFKNGRAMVRTASKKSGFINKQGELFIDTVYSQINSFVKGVAVVEGIHHHLYSDKEKGIQKNLEVGVIDSLGNFVVPYGRYKEIGDYANGYFKVEIPAEPWDSVEGFTAQTGFIDRNNTLVLAKDHRNNSWIGDNLSCGIANIHLYKNWLPEEDGTSFTTEKSYMGYINLNGEIIINDTTYKYASDFYDNRAFVKNDNWESYLINTQGALVTKTVFQDVFDPGFKDGFAFVKVNDQWGRIDTSGNFTIKPSFNSIEPPGMIEDYFFFTGNNTTLTGVANASGNIIIEPQLEQYDSRGFRNGLLFCVIDRKFTYINKEGKIIWQESGEQNQSVNFNIDFMNRGYFCAFSKRHKNDLGGFGGSDNSPKKVAKGNHFPESGLHVIVRPDEKRPIGSYPGIAVYIVNATKKSVLFDAQDSRLYMLVQARDTNGEWRDIEYLPSSWCGNSYHTLTLDAHNYWEFTTPVYEGDIKTRLRIALTYIDRPKKRGEQNTVTIYSNEYEGSINPGQFWRKESYYPHGIMDPYND